MAKTRIGPRRGIRPRSPTFLRGVGDALRDYILSGRGEPETDRVFVTSVGGHSLTPGLLTRMFSQRCRRAGVVKGIPVLTDRRQNRKKKLFRLV